MEAWRVGGYIEEEEADWGGRWRLDELPLLVEEHRHGWRVPQHFQTSDHLELPFILQVHKSDIIRSLSGRVPCFVP